MPTSHVTIIKKKTFPGDYLPRKRLQAFAVDLEKSLKEEPRIGEWAFRTLFERAFEHCRSMFMGDGSKFLKAVAKACGVDGRRAQRWTSGRDLPAPEERHAILVEVANYLRISYRLD